MMLSEAKITTKGQITIPIRVMKKLRIKPGDRVVFEQRGRHIEISSAAQTFSIDDFIKKYSNKTKIKLSQEQVNKARTQAWNRDAKDSKRDA